MFRTIHRSTPGCLEVAFLGAIALSGGCNGATTSSGDPVEATAELTTCEVHSDCVVVPKSEDCCVSCKAGEPDEVRAVNANSYEGARAEKCDDMACPAIGCIPISPRYLGACDAGTCAVVDLRDHPATNCTQAADCAVRDISCCGCGNTNDEIDSYIAISDSGADLPLCDGDTLCDRCAPPVPRGFVTTCVEGSCSVVDCSSGYPDDTGTCEARARDCFSPTQNLNAAYDTSVIGCECDAADESVCVADATGRLVALICNLETGIWNSVEDGPCMGR